MMRACDGVCLSGFGVGPAGHREVRLFQAEHNVVSRSCS